MLLEQTTNRHRGADEIWIGDVVATCEGRVLSGPVPIDKPAAVEFPQRLEHMRDRQHVTTDQKLMQRLQIRQTLVDHDLKQPRRQP